MGLKRVTNQIELWRQRQKDAQRQEEIEQEKQKEEEESTILDLLQELRDIIEQIDYARAFCALKGLNFILGIISSSLTTTTSTSTSTSTMVAGTTTKKNKTIDIIPQSIQMMCLGILSTLCQHNPQVQK